MARMVGSYELGETLGSGVEGTVKLAMDTATGQAVAIKVIKKDGLTPGSRKMRNLEREVQIMSTLKHDNIVQMLDVDWDAAYPKSDGTVVPRILIAMELAEGGELFDFMMHTGCFPEEIARTYWCQLQSALQHCHSNGVAHRDLKPENILLDGEFSLKVADFGLSAVHDGEGAPTGLRTRCGTVSYMAPEVLRREPYDGAKADVWSAGVILFIMLAGFPPFQQAGGSDWWYQRIRRGEYELFWRAHERSASFSAAAKALLNRVFVADPARRATVDELLKMEWSEQEALPMDTLRADLSRRAAQVERAKRAERERKRRDRAAAAVASFDAFDADVSRGAGGDAAADPFWDVADDSTAPTLPEGRPGPARYTRLFVRCAATAARDAAARALRDASCDVSEDTAGGTYALRATADGATASSAVGVPLRLSLAVYAVPGHEGVHMVDLAKRSGRLLRFQEIFAGVAEALAEREVGDPRVEEAEVAEEDGAEAKASWASAGGKLAAAPAPEDAEAAEAAATGSADGGSGGGSGEVDLAALADQLDSELM